MERNAQVDVSGLPDDVAQDYPDHDQGDEVVRLPEMIQPEDLNRTVQWLLSLSPGACVKEVILETPYNIS